MLVMEVRRPVDLRGALCANPVFDPESWFADDQTLRELAVLVCHRCPVRHACLQEALEEEEAQGYSFGVRGALTGSERREIIDRRKRTRGLSEM